MNMQRPTINFQGAGIGRSQKSRPRLSSAATAAIFPALLGGVFVAKGVRASNVPFYQTNPPIFGSKTAVINLRYNGLRGKNLSRNGGFVLENEPTGRGFGGGSNRGIGWFWGISALHRSATTTGRKEGRAHRARLQRREVEQGKLDALAPLDPSSFTLRALTRRNAISVLPAHLDFAKRTHL